MKTLCIYHGGCDDGFGAAFVIWKKFGDKVEFYPAMHGDAPPDVAGRDVIMVDFSYKRPILESMISICNSMIILDHHKTAQADLAGLSNSKLQVFFDMNRSGAQMTWDYYFPDTSRPPMIEYIGDRDLWIKKFHNVDEFTIALRSYPQNFETWDKLDWQNLIVEGYGIQRYYRTLVEDAKKNASLCHFDGHVVPVVNASHFLSSEVAGELSENHPFAATYSIKSNGMILYSLRSRTNGIDVSEIAKKYGGGGHFHAAGFQSNVTVHSIILGK